MLAKEVSDRPASVGEALQSLVNAGNEAGILAGVVLPLAPPSAPAVDSFRAHATVPTLEGAGGAGGARVSTDGSGAVRIVTSTVSETTNSRMPIGATTRKPSSIECVTLQSTVSHDGIDQ